jgi:hypothetical protein
LRDRTVSTNVMELWNSFIPQPFQLFFHLCNEFARFILQKKISQMATDHLKWFNNDLKYFSFASTDVSICLILLFSHWNIVTNLILNWSIKRLDGIQSCFPVCWLEQNQDFSFISYSCECRYKRTTLICCIHSDCNDDLWWKSRDRAFFLYKHIMRRCSNKACIRILHASCCL